MRVVAEKNLRDYCRTQSEAADQLLAWLEDTEAANWTSPHDITAQYASASILGNSRVCFNIKGNSYRLIVAVSYRNKIVLLKFIGTHAEYDRVDAETVEMF